MGSQGGSVRSSGSTMEELSLRSLSRQGSLYSLTLDEVQNQLGGLGKPLGSMNLDELLKSVWSVEASNGPDLDSLAMNTGHSLQRQPSFTLSRDLSKKTVEEVWKDIQHGNNKRGNDGESQHQNHEGGDQERQPTLGEMTLEDFLVKAGVVAESPLLNNPSAVLGVGSQQNMAQHAQWMHYQLPSVQNQQPQKVMTVFMPGHPTVQQPVPLGAPSILDVAYPEAQMTASPSSLMGTLSDTQTPGRKRVAPGDVVEKTVERRQKRMIKNRESAARSRARKQAYTHELENKVSHLEEENERLRRQREVEKVLPCAPPPEPKNRLRRTSSAPL